MARTKSACEEREQRWMELVGKWQRSGASQAVFCREQGLNANTFNFWKLRVLRQRPGKRRRRETPADGGSQFIPVRVAAPALRLATPSVQMATPASNTFEVCLRSGHSIRLASEFDETALRRLVGVLEHSSAC